MELVSPETAAKIAELGFPSGGYRWCPQCDRTMRVTLGQITEWTAVGIPRCRICGQSTTLLTPEEHERLA